MKCLIGKHVIELNGIGVCIRENPGRSLEFIELDASVFKRHDYLASNPIVDHGSLKIWINQTVHHNLIGDLAIAGGILDGSRIEGKNEIVPILHPLERFDLLDDAAIEIFPFVAGNAGIELDVVGSIRIEDAHPEVPQYGKRMVIQALTELMDDLRRSHEFLRMRDHPLYMTIVVIVAKLIDLSDLAFISLDLRMLACKSTKATVPEVVVNGLARGKNLCDDDLGFGIDCLAIILIAGLGTSVDG